MSNKSKWVSEAQEIFRTLDRDKALTDKLAAAIERSSPENPVTFDVADMSDAVEVIEAFSNGDPTLACDMADDGTVHCTGNNGPSHRGAWKVILRTVDNYFD